MNWTRAEYVVWDELDGEAMLVNPNTGARWTLNATALAVWKLCDGRRGVAELARMLDRSRAEIALFCQQFNQFGLLQPANVQTGASPAPLNAVLMRGKLTGAPAFKSFGLGNGPRRRPTARGVSGPV